MITVRQIEKLWNAKACERLLEQLLSPRPETSERLVELLCETPSGLAGAGMDPVTGARMPVAGLLPAAAMVVIRLDELAQSYVPLCGQLLSSILAAQRVDGGWGDTMITALCIRALLCGRGHGAAIDRGLDLLARLQKDEGIWPAMPVRRMPVDAFASAFVLMQLCDADAFRHAVRFDHAVEWFTENEPALEPGSKKLWSHARRRSVPARSIRVAKNTCDSTPLMFGALIPA